MIKVRVVCSWKVLHLYLGKKKSHNNLINALISSTSQTPFLVRIRLEVLVDFLCMYPKSQYGESDQ